MPKKTKKTVILPGEGERRAMRGYVPQYDFAAAVIYEAIANGQLRWVGLADRSAGNFDDVVLGLRDRTVCHQVKTRTAARVQSLRTLLLGGVGLMRSLAAAWLKVRATEGDPVEVIYVCDDYLADNDSLDPKAVPPFSSLAFLRTLGANRSWPLEHWIASPYGGFVAELKSATGLGDADFAAFWPNITIIAAGDGRRRHERSQPPHDRRRISDIAALLPRLVADDADKDRWTVEELLGRLNWRDPFTTRHGHAFPLDALVQVNPQTQARLQAALAKVASGYIALLGPPGCGKSTLLQVGLLPTPRAAVIRYLAFMPNEGHSLGRGEAFDFLHDVAAQLKRIGHGAQSVIGSTLEELRQQVAFMLLEASKEFKASGLRTIIVVDGLDHIPREERTDRPLLRELPLPPAVPEGVIFVLGTQRLDLSDLPPSVRDQALEAERCIEVAPLTKEAVFRLIDLSNVPADCDRDQVFERSHGHPLSTRYLIEGLLAAPTRAARGAWLRDGPAYGGDVEVFYQRAWHDIENSETAGEVLAFVAMVEGSVRPAALDRLVDPSSVDCAWKAASHLLRRSEDGSWQIFHNSFRLFLLGRTSTRHGLPSPERKAARYLKLADMAREAGSDDPQRWLELRYKARAEDHAGVLKLAKPRRFREQFIEGRSAKDICDDIRLAFAAARAQRDPSCLIELLLSRHEIEMRTEALGVSELVDACIATGELDKAMGLIDADGASLGGKSYEVVDALLSAGRAHDARIIFEENEPLDKLLGSQPIDGHSDNNELIEWAERAPLFRSPLDILASIDRLRLQERPFPEEFSLEQFKQRIRFEAARSVLDVDPSLDHGSVGAQYAISQEWMPFLQFVAARSADHGDMAELTVQRLAELVANRNQLDEAVRRQAAILCYGRQRLDLAREFFDGIARPNLDKRNSYHGDSLQRDCCAVFEHAWLEAALGQSRKQNDIAETDLIAQLQRYLEWLGWDYGRALAGRPAADDTLMQEIKKILIFLDRAQSTETGYDSDRWVLNKALKFSARAIAKTAAAHGPDVLTGVAEHVDVMLDGQAQHLKQPTFRRSFALAVFQHQRNAELALKRLVWTGSVGGERTPHEHIQEVAEEAMGLVRLGQADRAKKLLQSIHGEGLGYSRAAKKDPQYMMWRDLLSRACTEDAAGIPRRLAFMLRLLDGLSNTEGDNAGSRVTEEVLKWAGTMSAPVARKVIDHLENTGLTSWVEIMTSILTGLVMRRPDHASHACVAFGRLALPFVVDLRHGMVPHLFHHAPDDQLAFLAEHTAACAEIDAHEGIRLDVLREIVSGVNARGQQITLEALKRWASEDDATAPERTPDDDLPDISSISELEARLTSDGKVSSWRASRVVRRVAATARFSEMRSLLAARPEFIEEERILSTAVSLAAKEGKLEEVRPWLEKLRKNAENEGSWGGYQSGAKTRFYTVRVQLEGDKAREAAFEELAFDLSRGKEWTSSLLPDLGEILVLTKPRLTFSEVWERIEEHLKEFREYNSGEALVLPALAQDESSATGIIAHLYVRAIELRLGELTELARLGLREMAGLEGGAIITWSVIESLWSSGGDLALEAARIAWECRNIAGLRQRLEPHLATWATTSDLAVQRTIAVLAAHWGIQLPSTKRDLPAFYSLELPDDETGKDFEEPLGFSAFDEGLWTDDPYTWTWGLKLPLELLSKATRLRVERLRRRAAQFMTQQGGKAAFGPEVTKQLKRRMSRLEFRIFYRRPMTAAAMRAARTIGAELKSAEMLSTRDAIFFLREVGGFNLTTDTRAPSPRPKGFVKPAVPKFLGMASASEWARSCGEDNVELDLMPDWMCVASVARFERTHFAEVLAVDRLTLPEASTGECRSLSEAWSKLDDVLVAGSSLAAYRKQPAGAVVAVWPDAAHSFPDYGLTLCPRIANSVGIRPDEADPFTFRDTSGAIVVRTLWWREGGFRSGDTEDDLRGSGCALLVRGSAIDALAPFIGERVRVSAWRSFQERKDAAELTSSHHRVHKL